MRKTVLLCLAAILIMVSACDGGSKVCRIHGTVNNPNLEDACIYLIAFDKAIRDSVGIDSAFIKDGKFEISTKKNMVGILRMDYRYRYGIEELLVVEEPGDVYVTIDSISSGHGTKHNDIIQRWKELTSAAASKRLPMLKGSYKARQQNDPAQEYRLRAISDSIFVEYMNQTKDLIKECDKGPLQTFLKSRIPSVYQMHKADGSVEEIKF